VFAASSEPSDDDWQQDFSKTDSPQGWASQRLLTIGTPFQASENGSNKDSLADSYMTTDALRQSSCRKRAQHYVTENKSIPNGCLLTGEEPIVHDEKPQVLLAVRHIPLPYLILLSLLILLVGFTAQKLLHPVTELLCRIPTISSTMLCGYVLSQPLLVDFQLLGKIQSDSIDLLIGDSLGNSELVLKIAMAEMAADDLASAVHVSDFKSRDLLASLLDEFARCAGKVAEELQELHAQTVGTATIIISANGRALRSIEHAVLRDAVSWTPSYSSATDKALQLTFGEVMSVQTSELEGLVTKALFIKGHLDDLKEKLRAMHYIVVHEQRDFTGEEHELLSTLWSQLGGNILDKKRFRENLLLLDQLTKYHAQAERHVAGAVFALNNMRNQMKEARKAVGAPGITGPRIPLSEQTRGIQDAMENLQKSIIAAHEQRRYTGKQFLSDE
jgi:hypothetical protein